MGVVGLKFGTVTGTSLDQVPWLEKDDLTLSRRMTQREMESKTCGGYITGDFSLIRFLFPTNGVHHI